MQQLSFRLVGYGQSACDELAAVVRDAKADDPFAPVTVLVRSNYEGVALRRELTRQRAGLTGADLLAWVGQTFQRTTTAKPTPSSYP